MPRPRPDPRPRPNTRPRHDPVPRQRSPGGPPEESAPEDSARASLAGKLKRALRLLGIFSVLIAIIATLLVLRGQPVFQIHMMIATFVGMGLVVFLGGALMLLIFYSAASGHDELASRYDPEDKE